MLIWVLLALLTGAAVLTVLWPLSRRPVSQPDAATDVVFYRSQLAEIERDRERGGIGEAEAEAARIEASRRLIRAAGTVESPSDAAGEPALRRRRAAAALALSVVPIVGLGLYGGLGSPRLSSEASEPQARAAATAPPDVSTALSRMEDHLAAHPDDGRGWDLLAPIYLRMGRFDDAARAFGVARRLNGDTVERLVGHGEALVSADQGIVSAEARSVFERAVGMDPASPPARYYLALAAEQDGDRDRAVNGYSSLIADAPRDAPWRPLVERRLAAISGAPAAPRTVQATPEIAAMVSGLDERLKAGGGSEGEWARLIRSFVVLGRRDDALDRLARARTALAADPQTGPHLDELGRELGLTPDVARR